MNEQSDLLLNELVAACVAFGRQIEPDWQTRIGKAQDALKAYISKLEAENERLKACESALISMVNQFFYSNDDDNTLRHAFMSAEEEAANYLVEHGIAQWVDERKGAIYFKEVQE